VLARGAWRGIVVLTVLGIVTFGCGRESPTDVSEPGGEANRPGVAMAVAPTLSTTLSPTTSRTGIGPIPIGTYNEQTLVEIKATGLISRYWGYVWYYGTKQGQFDQQIDAAGLQNTQNAHIAFNSPAMGWFLDTQGLPLQEDWRKVVVVQGAGQVSWVRPGTGGQCDSPGTPDCFSYTGSFQVSVTPFPAELGLKASKPAVEPGQNVTFTASVTPDSIEGIGVPFKVAEWRWQPDAGGASTLLPQCENQKLCNYAPTVSGTMRAIGYANGAPDEATVHVTVLPCLLNDSLLDDPTVRDALREVLNGMGIGGPDSLRTERAAGLYCDADGSCTSELYPVGPNDNECSMYPPAAADTSDVLIHGHPFRPRSEFPNPEYCVINGVPYGDPPEARPSNHDFQNFAGPRILVVVDRANIYVVPRTADGLPPAPGSDGSYSGKYTKRNWSGPGAGMCDLTAPPVT
jgi:hypothetical protein